MQADGLATYLYRFNRTIDSEMFKLFGDYHSAELPYAWNQPQSGWSEDDYTLSYQWGWYVAFTSFSESHYLSLIIDTAT